MTSYKEKLDELRRNAEDKVRELDEKFNIRERLNDGARAAQRGAENLSENLREGAERLRNEAEKLRTEAEKMAQDNELSEHARQVAAEAARKAREVGDNLRESAEAAGTRASEVFGVSPEKTGEFFNDARERANDFFNDARNSVGNAARKTAGAFNFGLGWTRIFNNALSGISKAVIWTGDNPWKAAGTGFSVLFGIRLGSAVPFLSSHWLPNSALPVWGLKKASDQFNKYLTKQEELISKGELSEAEAERVRFEHDIVKFVGAPLLGAFSCAAGAAMWANIFQPGRVTGAPISWLLGGNPLLDGIWLFGNGIVCFKIGYDFFMIALEDQQEVQRIVREIKGLLPKAQEA